MDWTEPAPQQLEKPQEMTGIYFLTITKIGLKLILYNQTIIKKLTVQYILYQPCHLDQVHKIADIVSVITNKPLLR